MKPELARAIQHPPCTVVLGVAANIRPDLVHDVKRKKKWLHCDSNFGLVARSTRACGKNCQLYINWEKKNNPGRVKERCKWNNRHVYKSAATNNNTTVQYLSRVSVI